MWTISSPCTVTRTTGICGMPGPQKPNGLITMPVETGGCELHEEHPLDDRLNGPAFTSSPFVTRQYVALGRRSSALWCWIRAPGEPTACSRGASDT
jgi:hypothetical protein